MRWTRDGSIVSLSGFDNALFYFRLTFQKFCPVGSVWSRPLPGLFANADLKSRCFKSTRDYLQLLQSMSSCSHGDVKIPFVASSFGSVHVGAAFKSVLFVAVTDLTAAQLFLSLLTSLPWPLALSLFALLLAHKRLTIFFTEFLFLFFFIFCSATIHLVQLVRRLSALIFDIQRFAWGHLGLIVGILWVGCEVQPMWTFPWWLGFIDLILLGAWHFLLWTYSDFLYESGAVFLINTGLPTWIQLLISIYHDKLPLFHLVRKAVLLFSSQTCTEWFAGLSG